MSIPIDPPENRFGLSQTVIDQINGVLASYPAIERAIVYGSRAKGNYRIGSDIDLVLVGHDFSEDQLLELETRLDDLLLPYTIDLSRFEAIRNPRLIDHINRIGKVFFENNPPTTASCGALAARLLARVDAGEHDGVIS